MENNFRLKVVKVFQKVINRKTNNVFIPISIYVNKKKSRWITGLSYVCGQYCLRSFIALREHAAILLLRRLPSRPWGGPAFTPNM